MSGKVALAQRLPFGWSLSPVLFQSVTSAIADKLREKYGVKILVFCDDFIICGTRDEVLFGMQKFEELTARLGISWAPWKKEGPTRSLEFLGLRICNLDGERTISLPESKRVKLDAMLARYHVVYC